MLRNSKQWGAALSALLVLATLSVRPATAVDPYEINAIVSLTGPGSFLGKNEQAALALVESSVNKSGGIAGRSIKFVVADDQSSPQVAVQLTNPLIAKKVPLIIGSSLVGACNAMAPLVKESGPVLYCLSAGMHPDRSNPYSFTYGVPTDDLIVANLRYLRLRGLKKLAILTSTDASGQDGERGIDAGLALPENKELSVVAREHYATADLSVAAQISRIKESGAQALIAWGTGTPIGTVFHAVNDAGLTIPVSVSASNMIYPEMLQFSSFAPKDLISATPASIALDALPRGALHDAVRDYQEAFKAIGVNADVSQAISWDPAWIVVAALKKFGPAMTAAQFRDYLAGLHGFAGANGVYDFRTGDQRGLGGSQAGIMVRWDAAKQTWVGISKFGGVPK